MDTSLLYKPPLPDPDYTTIVRTERGRHLQAISASKRAKRHAHMEENRESGKKLMERNDLDKKERKRYTVVYHERLDRLIAYWKDFHCSKLHDTGSGRYFEPGGPLPNQVLLRQFFIWLVDCSYGNIASASLRPSDGTNNNNISQSTVIMYAMALFAAFAHNNSRLDRELVSQTVLWIKGSLTDEANLNREPKRKTTAYHHDVEIIIKTIWQWKSLASLKHLGNIFALTLTLNLLVDGASRVGEFVPTTKDAINKQAYLKWRDIEFWICNDQSGDTTIYCIVRCKWL